MLKPRAIIGIVATVCAGALTAGIILTDTVRLDLDAPTAATDVQPVEVSRNLVCAGRVLATDTETGSWTSIANAKVRVSGGDIAGELLGDAGSAGSIVAFTETPADVMATEFALLNGSSAAGLLAAECGDPVNEQWLVAGSAETGRDGIVTISNASNVDAQVNLEFWGAEGPISAPAAAGLVVAAGTQKSYSLAGFVPNEKAPVIRVTSNGAAIWATLQLTTTRGLTAGGVDRVTGSSAPATVLTVPIVRPPDEKTVGPLRKDPEYLDTVTELRLLSPGESDANATVTLTPFDGTDPVVFDAIAPAGKSYGVSIEELVHGDFSVRIDSDQPLVAAVRFASHSTSTDVTDLAWATAVPSLSGSITSYVPLDNSTLAIANPGAEEASVTVSIDGVPTDVVVPAMSATTLVVDRGALRIDSATPVAASVLVENEFGVAVVKLTSQPVGARSVTVIAH